MHAIIPVLALALLLLLPPGHAGAAIYSYQDAGGRTVYVDDAQKIPPQFRSGTSTIQERRDLPAAAAEQAAGIMTRYEKALQQDRSDLCLVVGDVTSTMACAIAAQELAVPTLVAGTADDQLFAHLDRLHGVPAQLRIERFGNGARDALLPEIAGTAAYRVAPGVNLRGLEMPSVLAAAVERLRDGGGTLGEIAVDETTIPVEGERKPATQRTSGSSSRSSSSEIGRRSVTPLAIALSM